MRNAVVILAATALCAAHARAGSELGSDAAQGTTFNRRGDDPTLERDSRGKSLLIPAPSRTPGGFLYDSPYEIPRALPLGDGWDYRLAAELGGVAAHGPWGTGRFRDYADPRDGVLLNYLDFGLEQARTARYLDIRAGAVGRSDQYVRAMLGRYGDFKASIYFSEIAKVFTDQARTVFNGAGTGILTLPSGLAPGDNTPAQVQAALEAARPFELGFSRKNAAVDWDATPDPRWRIHARYGQERKKGERPLGGASSYPGTPAVELIEPIDYLTHNVLAGVQWTGAALQANLGYAGSFFRNAIDTLTWEHPLTVGDPSVQRGRMDLYPDNDSHNLKLDWSAALPLRGRLSGGVSYSRMAQNDRLIPPTINSGRLIGTPVVDLENWNTTGALNQRTAGARIDTWLYHLAVSLSPLRDLSLQARLRSYSENNRTRYIAFNPLTGQFGYLGLDGSNNSNIVPGLFRVPIAGIPFERSVDSYGVEADYRPLRRTNVTFGYSRERNQNPYRETGETMEHRLRAGLNNRDIPWATLRLSFEHAERSGEGHRHDPNRLFYSETALINAPATLAELRKYDLADRRQQLANVRVNLLATPGMDVALSGRVVDNHYDAAYGRLGERMRAFNLEWNWQPFPAASAYAHYGFERRHNRMALVSDNPGGWITGNPAAGGAAYPLANRWNETSRDDAHTLGLGFRYAFARATLESAYTYLYAPYRTRYGFESGGALASGTAGAAAAGDGMPDLVFRSRALETSLRIRLDRNTALRVYYRYQRARFEDWHYDGMPLLPANGSWLFLGAGPQDYRVNLFGLFFQYTPGKHETNGR